MRSRSLPRPDPELVLSHKTSSRARSRHKFCPTGKGIIDQILPPSPSRTQIEMDAVLLCHYCVHRGFVPRPATKGLPTQISGPKSPHPPHCDPCRQAVNKLLGGHPNPALAEAMRTMNVKLEAVSVDIDAATGVAARRVAPSTNPKRLRGASAAVTVVASAVVASAAAVASSSQFGMVMVPSSVSSAAHADMQEELARSQRQLQETEAKLQEVERSAAEAAKEQARVLAEREEAWSAKLREARAVSERHQTELDKQAAALRALEQQLAAAEERAVADKAALALSREQAVVEREPREQLEATLRAKSQALEEATVTIAELRHQLAAATKTNVELRHQPESATNTNAELRHQPGASTETNAELLHQPEAATVTIAEQVRHQLAAVDEAVDGQRMEEVASARVDVKYGGVVDITVHSQPCGGTLVIRHFEMSNSMKQLYAVIATRLGATRDDKISVLHLGRLIPNDGTPLCGTSIATSGPENKHGVHLTVAITRKAVVASITNKSLADNAASDSRTPAATERYLKPLEITVRMMTGASYKVEDIGLRHTTGQLYARVAQVTGISLDVLCVLTGERTPLPNDDTVIGDTTLRWTQCPCVYATMRRYHGSHSPSPGVDEL